MAKKIITILIIGVIGLIILGSITLSSLGGKRGGGEFVGKGREGVITIDNPLQPKTLSFPTINDLWGTKESSVPSGETNASEVSSRLVIKSGIINMVVRDIAVTVNNIAQYTEEKGGWVVQRTVSETEKVLRGSITVRVPAEIFEEAIKYFKGLAEKVSYESTQGQDVTEEYVDLQSRLRNLESAEVQLLKIMERSGTITDVLAVQRELTNVRSQIEQTKGRIKYLEESSEMATVNINLALSEDLLPIPEGAKWRPTYVAKQAWSSLLGTLKVLSYILIWLGIYLFIIIPAIIVIFILIPAAFTIRWFIAKFLRKVKEKRKISE